MPLPSAFAPQAQGSSPRPGSRGTVEHPVEMMVDIGRRCWAQASQSTVWGRSIRRAQSRAVGFIKPPLAPSSKLQLQRQQPPAPSQSSIVYWRLPLLAFAPPRLKTSLYTSGLRAPHVCVKRPVSLLAVRLPDPQGTYLGRAPITSLTCLQTSSPHCAALPAASALSDDDHPRVASRRRR